MNTQPTPYSSEGTANHSSTYLWPHQLGEKDELMIQNCTPKTVSGIWIATPESSDQSTLENLTVKP